MQSESRTSRFNAAQQNAIETIEGPVMVIAGPGTGKTTILTHRIAHILKVTDTSASSILCLTYTDAAANEMRNRLIELIGPTAYQVQISTFHAFCNLVIRDNPGIFQQARELEPVTDIDRFAILQKLIDGFSNDHLLKKFKGLTYQVGQKLHGLFMTMKKENWTPEIMYRAIDEYIEQKRQSEEFIYKVTRNGYNKGDFKEKDFKKKVLDRMEDTRAAVGEFDRYNALMAEEGRYDFEDMLIWVYNAFQQHPDLLADYQERFLYFLVDEFQDTNGIQMDLLESLIDHEFIDRPNVFVVGDDDQAIYRFQGANIENLVRFQQKYHPKVILLEENYRSSQVILDAARKLMTPVDDALMKHIFGSTKRIAAAGKYAQSEQPVHILSCPTPTYENTEIFHQIKTWHAENPKGTFAILYPKHDHGKPLAQALRGAGIPFRTVQVNDTLHNQVVRHLIDIMNCIHALGESPVHDDGLLYRILHGEWMNPRHDDLQRLILAYTRKGRDEHDTLFQWICNPEKLDALKLRDPADMAAKAKLLQDAISKYHTVPLMVFAEWAVHHFGLMSWLLKSDEKFHHLYALKSFFNFIEQQAAGKPSYRVPDLLTICDLMRLYEIRLPMQTLAPPTAGIVLSTIHGAKGLEYDKVVIKNTTDNEWEKKQPYTNKFALPDNLMIRVADNEDETKDHDLRRLLYVGMTRARYDLALTFARKNDAGKGLTPSLYLTELAEGEPTLPRIELETDELRQQEYLVALMSGSQEIDVQLDADEIRDRVRNYVLNVSALNLYLECPIRFFYEKILVIPSAKNAYLIFGSGLHDALQQFFRKRFLEHDTTRNKEYLQNLYEYFLDRNRHFFTEKEWDDMITYGRKVLGLFYDQYAATWSDEVTYVPEYHLTNLQIDGVPVSGFIDRIDKMGNVLVVYDYKSGRTDKFPVKLKRPDDKFPNGGDYWRQMVFYDLMLQQDPKYKRTMNYGVIQALEPEKDGSFIERQMEITAEEHDIVRQQIREVYDKIQRMEFNTGCGQCAWCEMHGRMPEEPTTR